MSDTFIPKTDSMILLPYWLKVELTAKKCEPLFIFALGMRV